MALSKQKILCAKMLLGATFLSGFFLFLDQSLKSMAVNNPSKSYYLIKNIVGWEYYENYGIAFSLPMPKFLLITFIPIIIASLIIFLMKTKKKKFWLIFGTSLVIAGAISNLIDRVFLGFVVDYFRVFTSVINIADIMIIVGGLILVVPSLKKKQ
ncbi:MAG: signal peptidase II [Candidatus Magasanikbacteria bacterium]|nr:signal peptidase II [Candidatus Magasanikbacteria bacterium]